MRSFFERVRAALAQKGYQVEGDHELGNGGMGIVVLARQSRLNRLVAVKVIRPEFHTAIAVQVFDAGESQGLPYYAMEYLVGDTVAARILRGPLSPAEVRQLGCALLDARARIAALHRAAVA